MKHVIKKAPKIKLDEKKEELIKDLIEVFNKMNYKVRIEKGLFKGGFCLLKEQRLFLLNKNIEQDKKINFLVQNLSLLGTEGIFLKPNIRELIENAQTSDVNEK